MAKRRYRRYGNFGAALTKVSDYLPVIIGAGGAMATTLLIRAFVKPIKADGTENVFFKYAGWMGAGAGVLASGVVGWKTGWPKGVQGGVAALLTGGTAALYDKVVPAATGTPPAGYGYMIGRRSPLSGPAWFAGKRGYGYMAARSLENQLPENTTSFPAEQFTTVNAKAWGGGD